MAPKIADITAVTLYINVSAGATLSQGAEGPHNFSYGEVKIMVTAEDGVTKREYTIKINNIDGPVEPPDDTLGEEVEFEFRYAGGARPFQFASIVHFNKLLRTTS